MLPTDIALIEDPSFKPWVDKYAEDRELFYQDFSNAFAKLIELGVDRSQPVSLCFLVEGSRWLIFFVGP